MRDIHMTEWDAGKTLKKAAAWMGSGTSGWPPAEDGNEPALGGNAPRARARPLVPAGSRVGPAVVFLYSHDTFGLGHLRRNLAIAERLLASGQFSVHLLTGSPVIAQWHLPPGLHVHPMPPVVKTGAERYAARDAAKAFALVKGYRSALILTLAMRYRPEVFLVDHAPAGMNGELLPALAMMRRDLPSTRIMLGLRDILDSPEIVRATWDEQDIHALLEQAYDDILVYGSQTLFDVVEAYGIEAATAGRVRYCGHVVAADLAGPASADQPPCWDQARAHGRPVVLVTAGGGGDGFALMDAYLTACRQTPPGTRHSVIVTGPLMSAEQRAALTAAAAGREDIELIDYLTDPLPSLRAADLVIAMAGYNTSAELIAARKRAIIVPRPAPRAEQRLRAALLARLGLVRMIEQGPDLAAQLAREIAAALATPPPAETAWAQLDLNGAERVMAHLTATLEARATANFTWEST
ncbi:glycosyltransferase family protein [Acidocella sp.]|uniref:glycosyltransferase family protein n=1 Tax=Acidocella sp. TaxID=50710 RepID=UPI00261F5DC7|nr:glycosyltransferase [Acidocella sp.]